VKRRILATLMVALAGSASAASPRATPVDAQADARARAEYTWLVQTWGRQTIAGQQDLTWNDSVDMASGD